MSEPQRLTIRVVQKEPLGMCLITQDGNSIVCRVDAQDSEKQRALNMVLHSIVSASAGEQLLLGCNAKDAGKCIKEATPPYSLVFEGSPEGPRPKTLLFPALEEDIKRISESPKAVKPEPVPSKPKLTPQQEEELRYATPSSIKACHEAARNMHAASVQLTKGDPEAAAMLETKANELFDKGRRCRDIFRRNTELGSYISSNRAKEAHSAEMLRAIKESQAEWEEAEKRRKCLQDQLERWGYKERAVPDDNNCQFHAIADQLNIEGTLPCKERQNGLWNATVTRKKIVQWLEKNPKIHMDDGAVGEPTTLMMATGYMNSRQWKAYCRNMSRAGITWGDEVTLVAACAVFSCQISVISSLTSDCIQTIESPAAWGIPAERNLVIAHYAEYHYASVQELRYGQVVDDEDLKLSQEGGDHPDYMAESKLDLHTPDGLLVGPGNGAPAEDMYAARKKR